MLCGCAGMNPQNLRRVLVAGLFGNHLDLDNAATIGLLPRLPEGRLARVVGNAALAGACALLLCADARRMLERARGVAPSSISAEWRRSTMPLSTISFSNRWLRPMRCSPFDPRTPVDAVVRTAQYLAGIVSYEGLWPQLARLVRNFFGADVAAFVAREAEGGERCLHCEPDCPMLVAACAEASGLVFERLFATEAVRIPIRARSDPAAHRSRAQRTAYVLIAAHRGAMELSRDTLDLYLALAGLIETTLDRIASQHRFLSMADNVPELLFQLVEHDGTWMFGYASGGARAALGVRRRR